MQDDKLSEYRFDLIGLLFCFKLSVWRKGQLNTYYPKSLLIQGLISIYNYKLSIRINNSSYSSSIITQNQWHYNPLSSRLISLISWAMLIWSTLSFIRPRHWGVMKSWERSSLKVGGIRIKGMTLGGCSLLWWRSLVTKYNFYKVK